MFCTIFVFIIDAKFIPKYLIVELNEKYLIQRPIWQTFYNTFKFVVTYFSTKYFLYLLVANPLHNTFTLKTFRKVFGICYII